MADSYDIDILQKELNKLRRFKRTVHSMLDEACVPKFEGEECRVAKRLEYVLDHYSRRV